MSPSLPQRGVDLADRGLRRVRRLRFDRQHQREAEMARHGLEASLGRRLTGAQRAECRDYARGVLGSTAYAPWLEVFTTAQGVFREGWLPDNYFGWYIIPAITRGLGPLGAIRPLTSRLLPGAPLPDVAFVVDGHLRDTAMALVDAPSFLRQIAAEHEFVVVKADNSMRSRGTRVMRTRDLDPDAARAIGNGSIQYLVRQHAEFERMAPGPVVTLRITTTVELDGTTAMRGAYLRMGRRGSDVLQPEDGTRAEVRPDGRLLDLGIDATWHAHAAHPDTGVSYGDWPVPSFAEAVRVCTSLHSRVPHVGVIGWDVTVDESGRVMVLEWNIAHPGIRLSEAMSGPCYTGLGWEGLARAARG